MVFSCTFWQQTLFWKILPGPSMYKLQIKAKLLWFKSGKNLGVEPAASFPTASPPSPHHYHHHPGGPCNTVSHKQTFVSQSCWYLKFWVDLHQSLWLVKGIWGYDCETLGWHQMSSGTQPEWCQCWTQARPSFASLCVPFPKAPGMSLHHGWLSEQVTST